MTRKLRRILICCTGSLGDLYPYLSVAIALREAGYAIIFGSDPRYQPLVEGNGLTFHPIRPDLQLALQKHRKATALSRQNSEFIIRQLLMPQLRDSYTDTLMAAREADLLISHPLTYAVPLVAEALNLPWIGTVSQPMTLFSVHDPPLIPKAHFLSYFQSFGPDFFQFVFQQVRKVSLGWAQPVMALRQELGLPETNRHPIMEGQLSPDLNLAFFPGWFAHPQPDWPTNLLMTGFQFYQEQNPVDPLEPERLKKFFETGSPPVVISFGSPIKKEMVNLYKTLIAALNALGRRGVILADEASKGQLQACVEPHISVTGYVPYARIFPQASVIVNHGGIGTIALAMAAGKPMLIVPSVNDQPDNAARAEKLGVALVLSPHRINRRNIQYALKRLLDSQEFSIKARRISDQIHQSDASSIVVEAVSSLFSNLGLGPSGTQKPLGRSEAGTHRALDP